MVWFWRVMALAIYILFIYLPWIFGIHSLFVAKKEWFKLPRPLSKLILEFIVFNTLALRTSLEA